MANSILAVKWERFFVDVGIPERIASEYAKKFTEQRVQFEMRGELTKNILVELGIKALGDQLAILHYLKKESEAADTMDTTASSLPTALVSNAKTDSEPAVAKKVPKAPDRDDIYHIRMPSGSTPKTREILKKQTFLRSAGLMKRGMNGIRKSGKEVRPAGKNVGQRIGGGSTSSTEVTSTTHEVNERLGVRGLVSDSLPEPKVFINTMSSVANVRYQNRAKKAENPAALFKRSIRETALLENSEPVFRVCLPVTPEPMGQRIFVQRKQMRKPTFMRIKDRVITKTVPVMLPKTVQKRLSIVERLSLQPNTAVTNRRQIKKSVFDRLG